ncbi:ABC transporter ATP-binding protein [Desulfurobacterium sp.]
MLEVINLNYKNILKDITFTAERQKITGIIGKNGSGKTTLLKAITGFLKCTGRITLNGIDITAISNAERIKKINLLPQEFPQSLLSVEKILQLTASLTERKTDVKKIAEKYRLTHLENRPLTSLSGGEKVRLFLARIEIINPEVILLDEPSAFLDISVLKILKEFVMRMKELSKIVIIVSNDLNFILNTADRLVGIKYGKTLKCHQNLERFLSSLYDCKIEISAIKGKKHVIT